MSPFDLPGPMFLVFYLLCGGVALLGLAMLHNSAESPDATKVNLSDPYLIACLRGGRREAVRVLTVSLIDRGLLKISGSTVSAVGSNAGYGVRLPVEQQLLTYCQSPQEAASLNSAHCLDGAMSLYEQELVQLGLLPNDHTKSARAFRLVVFVAVMWGIAVYKILLAIERGRTNYAFLVILSIAFAWAAYKITHPRQSGRGKALIADLKSLFGALKERAGSFHPGSNPSELALLAAVFGVDAIPIDVFPHRKTLYPQVSASSGSCGSSRGSSCGGGGCGGGCGGCGS